MRRITLALAGMLAASPAAADISAAEYFARDKAHNWTGALINDVHTPFGTTECEYGIAAGIMHMQRCVAAGVRTHAQMSACHVAGWGGWQRRLASRAERYKQQYIRMAMR